MPRVLACLADSPRARAVAAAARAWAETLGAELTLLHVAEDEAAAARWMQQNQDRREFGARVVVDHGKPAHAICRTAAAIAADLVVLGALEEDRLVTSLLGSVARRVARRAPCSVLLLTDPQHAELRSIVASVSFDDHSLAMAEFVLAVARRRKIKTLHLIHEFDSYRSLLRKLGHETTGPQATPELGAEQEIEQLALFLARLDAEGVPMRAECVDGHVGQAAVDYAAEHQADLLVVPAPTKLSFWDRFFNHPAELALQHLPCSLLLYRAPVENAR